MITLSKILLDILPLPNISGHTDLEKRITSYDASISVSFKDL